MSDARVLLGQVLALLIVAEETPLADRVDAGGMAEAALARAAAQLGRPVGGAWPALRAGMDVLLGARPSAAPGLAAWLADLYSRFRRSHPQAAAAAALRLDGEDDAAIAERLGLGPRLVARLLAEAAC
ncbi:MAG: hypothetical protein IT452_15715 [Planctomycetia bacterium]|nr:hypothetical protein [Planctomycetia bacterium]